MQHTCRRSDTEHNTSTAGPQGPARWWASPTLLPPVHGHQYHSITKHADCGCHIGQNALPIRSNQIDDSSVFPAQFGAPFPPDFSEVVRTIFKRLFRVYAHIYHSHFKQVCALGEEAHLNTCFKHFIHFVKVSAGCGVLRVGRGAGQDGGWVVFKHARACGKWVGKVRGGKRASGDKKG